MMTINFSNFLQRAALCVSSAAFLLGGGASAVRAQAPTLGESTLGNIFVTTQTVTIPVTYTVGNGISYVATDFWGNTVASGTTPVSGNAATVTPTLGGKVGWFDLKVTATENGASIGTTETNFALVKPFTPVSGSPFCTDTHFAQGWNTNIIPLIQAAGITGVRDEMYWEQVETTKGEYNFGNFNYYMSQLAGANIDPLVIFDSGSAPGWGNPLYDSGGTPNESTGYNAYASYAAAALQNYGSQIKNVEVWNEYNGSFVGGVPAQNGNFNYREPYYDGLLLPTYQAVKTQNSSVTVVSAGTAGIPLPYFANTFADSSGINSLDAVGIHPYRYISPPEGIEKDIAALKLAVASSNSGFQKPIWATEFGWYVNTPGYGMLAITPYNQAKFLARAFPLMLSEGVTRAYWYQFQNDSNNQPFGLIRAYNDPLGEDTPTPAYLAMSTSARQLSGTSYTTTENTVAGTYSILFSKSGTNLRVLWAPAGASIALNTTANLTQTDMMGNQTTLTPTSGVVTINLTDSPVYVYGNATLSALAPQPEVIADSVRDYSATQHPNGGWNYGYVTSPNSSTPPTGYTSIASTIGTDNGDYNWQWNGSYWYLCMNSTTQQPSSSGGNTQIWADRRWVCPVAGTVQIQAQFTLPSTQSQGVDAHVYCDGTAMFAPALNTTNGLTASCSFNYTAHVGSVIDFAIDPGPGYNNNFDSTMVSATIELVESSSAPQCVNLAPFFNVSGRYQNGEAFNTGGLDNQGFAYSDFLISTGLEWNSAPFILGPTDAPNAVSGGVVTLPAAKYSTLRLLGTGVSGSQKSQVFTVTYSDATTTKFTQSLSDWGSAQGYTGESTVQTMAYRNEANGTSNNSNFNLYGYSFALNKAKTVKSITLPSNRYVVVLAITLLP